MNRYNKPKPEFKIESVEEFRARGGHVKHVDFAKAYDDCKRFGLGVKRAADNREIARKAKLRAKNENTHTT